MGRRLGKAADITPDGPWASDYQIDQPINGTDAYLEWFTVFFGRLPVSWYYMYSSLTVIGHDSSHAAPANYTINCNVK